MARKINVREQHRPRTVVVGAGITEYWYLKHLKKLQSYNYVLQPSLFGDESMQTIQQRIQDAISGGASVICVFDEDVRQWNDTERRRMDEIHNRYDDNKQVVIASSMPSIEYWFLLHYENTNRFFGTSNKVIQILKKYIQKFDKKDQFLRQEKWVETMVEDNKMNDASDRAKRLGHSGESYSDFWRAIDKLNRGTIM